MAGPGGYPQQQQPGLRPPGAPAAAPRPMGESLVIARAIGEPWIALRRQGVHRRRRTLPLLPPLAQASRCLPPCSIAGYAPQPVPGAANGFPAAAPPGPKPPQPAGVGMPGAAPAPMPGAMIGQRGAAAMLLVHIPLLLRNTGCRCG